MAKKCVTVWIREVALHAAASQAIFDLGFELDEISDTVHSSSNEITDHLVARQPALVLVELNASLDWLNVITTIKTSPATRRLPVLAIAHDDANVTEAARRAGSNATVGASEFVTNAASLIQHHAKPDDSAELTRQAQMPLPELAHKAIEQFNQQEFFEQHELFEELWRAEPGPVRQMYQGILQVGVAYLQIQRQNYVGARKLFQRAWQYLNVLPNVCRGVNIAQLKADTQAAQAELERLGPQRISEFSVVFFKPITFTIFN